LSFVQFEVTKNYKEKAMLLFHLKKIPLKSLILILASLFLNFANASKYEFAVIGDAGKWNFDTRNIYESLLRHNVKKLVMPGDNLYGSTFLGATYEVVWAPWRLANFNFDVVAIGNHNAGYTNEMIYFNMPAEAYSVLYDDQVHFIVLNSDNNKSAAMQASFLDKELAQTTSRFVFLVYHHPTYTVSIYHSAREKHKFQSAMRPIIKKYREKISGLIVGHDHVSLIAHYDDLPVILSGSSHEQRRHIPLNYTKDGVGVQTNWFNDSAALWARLIIDSTLSHAKVDYIRGYDDKNMCSISIVTGRAADFMANCFQEELMSWNYLNSLGKNL